MRKSPLLFVVPLLTSFTALLGCRDAKMAQYRVRREAPPPTAAAPASDMAALPHLHWKAPTGWQEQPTGNVRLASFLIATEDGRRADMAVTQFPGDVGGDLANVNRWRGQLQLPPISEAELSGAITKTEFPTGTYSMTDLVSEGPIIEGKHRARMLGAWLKTPERTWFFKLTGEDALVQANRGAFAEFIRSVEYDTSTHGAAPDAPMAPTVAEAPALQGSAHIAWTAPAAWTPKPLSQMRKGSYALRGASGAEADLSILSFPGEAGGIAENLNRWRGQVQLPPLSPADLASSAHTLAHAGLRFTIVDFKGTSAAGPTRLLGAVLPLENETYFFKLMGPEDVVEQHKAAFLEFLKTVKQP